MTEPKIPPHIAELISVLSSFVPARSFEIQKSCAHIYRAGFIDGAVAQSCEQDAKSGPTRAA